jgi:hypothetical protein
VALGNMDENWGWLSTYFLNRWEQVWYMMLHCISDRLCQELHFASFRRSK